MIERSLEGHKECGKTSRTMMMRKERDDCIEMTILSYAFFFLLLEFDNFE